MSDQPQKPAAVAAGDESTVGAPPGEVAARDDAATQAERADADARATELREELAITDERRAEEELAKAEEAKEAAEKEEAKREQKRREAEERRRAAAEQSERAREQAGGGGDDAASSTGVVSGASVTAPGVGVESDPKAAATAGAGARASRLPRSPRAADSPTVEGPEKPELHVAAAFAAAFLFARVLKAIAG